MTDSNFPKFIHLFSILLSLTSCDGNQVQPFKITPDTISIEDFTPGIPVERFVRIYNVSSEDLKLNEIRAVSIARSMSLLDYKLSSDESVEFKNGFTPSQNFFPELLVLPPSEHLDLRLTFYPDESGVGLVGSIIIGTHSDPSAISIPIKSVRITSDLVFVPSSLNFAEVNVGQSFTQEVELLNQGKTTAFLNRIFINQYHHYSVSLNNQDLLDSAEEAARVLNDPDRDGTVGLSAGKVARFQVTYEPKDLLFRKVDLEIAVEGNRTSPIKLPLKSGISQ